MKRRCVAKGGVRNDFLVGNTLPTPDDMAFLLPSSNRVTVYMRSNYPGLRGAAIGVGVSAVTRQPVSDCAGAPRL